MDLGIRILLAIVPAEQRRPDLSAAAAGTHHPALHVIIRKPHYPHPDLTIEETNSRKAKIGQGDED
jgi:hypothetical protein